MLSILVTIIVALVLFYIARLVIAELGLPGNIARIIYVVLALAVFLWLLNFLGVYSFPIR